MRSSCETVATKSDFTWSRRRSSETSRIANTVPGSSSRGSRSEAAVIESQMSRPPRSRRTSSGALVPAAAAASAARATPSESPSSLRRSSPSSRPSTRRARMPVTRSAAAFQRVMRSSASEATIASATWARIASPASFSCATRSYRSALRSATAAELARAARPSTSSARKLRGVRGVHGEHALDLAVRRLHGHPEVGRESRVAHDRIVRQARVGRQVGYRHRCRSRERLGGDRIARERAAVREQIGGIAEHGARDELVRPRAGAGCMRRP